MWTPMRPIDRKMMTHYQVLLGAICGESVLVYGNGDTKKTQLEEHEETCPKCIRIKRRQKIEKICSKRKI